MYATKQTARKTTGGRVGPYTWAGDRVEVEDEDEEIGDTGEDEEEDGVCATLLVQANMPASCRTVSINSTLQIATSLHIYLVYCC